MASLLDRAMDFTVLPGYSRIGHAIRSRHWDPDPRLDGRSILLTGASSGIGAAACERFASAGAHVHMLVRNRERGEERRAEIADRTGSDSIHLEVCDVSSLASVRTFAAGFTARVDALDALVNNAGVMPGERTYTDEGFELTFATNVLGPFLLTRLLEESLRRGAPSSVVNVSSGGMYTEGLQADDLQLAEREYDPPAFYAHTKRCEVILAELWAERLAGSGVAAHSMHPGWADTPGVETSLPRFHKLMGPLLRNAGQGADTIVWLVGSSEAAAQAGAFWHDREPRPRHRMSRTKETAADRERLWNGCEQLAGLA